MIDTNLPANQSLKVRWTLPANWTARECDRFLEGAIRIVGKPEWSTITGDNGEEYYCVDVADVSFPGFLQGEWLDNGQPALNEYIVTLNPRDIIKMGALLRLLSVYGADVKWEVFAENVSVLS
jgi:hypothetical protein